MLVRAENVELNNNVRVGEEVVSQRIHYIEKQVLPCIRDEHGRLAYCGMAWLQLIQILAEGLFCRLGDFLLELHIHTVVVLPSRAALPPHIARKSVRR